MFELKIDAKEGWDASKNEFVQTKATILCLEHSLVSLSKWEAHFRKPYLSTEKKTREEIQRNTRKYFWSFCFFSNKAK